MAQYTVNLVTGDNIYHSFVIDATNEYDAIAKAAEQFSAESLENKEKTIKNIDATRSGN